MSLVSTALLSVASYYIYYRVAADQAVAAVSMLGILQQKLAQATGVHGRRLVKRGEPHLWMEVYEDVGNAGAFEAALEAVVSELGFETVLAKGAQRHVECFEPG